MGYIFNPQDVKDFSRTVPGETFEYKGELFFNKCPYCHGGTNGKDTKTFSVNLTNGAFKCFRTKCKKQGHFVELARDFNYRLEFKDNGTKQYKKLAQPKKIESRDDAVKYLESRGISRDVTEKYQITTRKDNPNILVIPFFDENNVLVFVKYRNLKNKGAGKEFCEKDAKPILFGMNHCDGFDRLIITEGQFDALALTESGLSNAVSVPLGSMAFTWIEHVWEWIIRFKEIIIFGDCEKDKVTLIDALQRRLPQPVKCVSAGDYLGEKDANDILKKYGKNAIHTAVNNAIVPKLPNVKRLKDVTRVDIYNLPRVYTGIPELDKVIGGLFFSQLILLTGKRGHGKSTWMSQLALEALDQRYKVFVYSGELADYHFKNWADLQAAGVENLKENLNQWNEKSYAVKPVVGEMIDNWYGDDFYLYDNEYIDENAELEELLETLENAIKRYGINFICIDNLMTALDIGMRDDLNRAQSNFVKKLKLLTRKHNVSIVLVAHPRKSISTNGNSNDFNDDVSGSSDIVNLVDTVLIYEKNENPEIDCDSRLMVTKNRLTGKLAFKDDAIPLFYSDASKRISSLQSKAKRYGWEKMNKNVALDDDIDLPFY